MRDKLRLFLMLWLAAGVWSLFAQPEIKFVRERLNFGEIESDREIDLVFEFKNAGNKVLVIKNVVPDCGCTTHQLEKIEYKPGETGKITVKFDSTGYNGKVIKGITVFTNDEKNKSVNLYIEGVVVNRNIIKVVLEPESLDFGKLKTGQKVTRSVIITNSGNKTLQLVEYTVDPEISLVFQKKSLKAGEKTKLEITFTALEKGDYNYLLKIRTNNVMKLYEIIKVVAVVD